MTDLIIKVENDKVKYGMELFIDNYKEHIVQFINNVLKGEGLISDSFIQKTEDGTLEVYQTAPDKGYVLAETSENVVQLSEYKTLGVGTKYSLFDGNKLALFLKEPDGQPDIKVGHFLNLNDVVKQINSESVKGAIDNILKRREDDAKELEKVERKAKIKKLASNGTK